jgi:amino acid permease
MKADKIIANIVEDTDSQEDAEIVKKARKRVGFKIHFIIYILTCMVIWLFWIFVFKVSIDLNQPAFNTALFITLVWGICIIVHYLIVYKWDKTYLEKEIKYLKKRKEQQQQQIENHLNQDKDTL